MTKYKFAQVFDVLADGKITPKVRINVNGIVLGPGVAFSEGVGFGGIDLHSYKGCDIGAVEQNGVLIIKNFYKPGLSIA